MPQISVIIPVYKVEQYIERCINSILQQSYTDFEVILVDDGSPDNSGTICDTYLQRDNRIIVLHQKNHGLSAARNSGISVATGEYFLFVDADDMIHPDCLKILMTCIQQTNADIAIGNFSRFDSDTLSDNNFTSWDETYTTKTGENTLHCFFDNIDNLPSLVSACGKLWHRKLFDNIQFPIGRLFEDEFTTYKLYHKANTIVFVNIKLYFYFINNAGITQNLTTEKRFDEYDAQWERIQYFLHTNLFELLGKACMTFLNTAQWDLIECRAHPTHVSSIKKENFEKQYYKTFQIAKKMKLLDFFKHYDYYILAVPKYSLLLRIKRQLMLLFRKV